MNRDRHKDDLRGRLRKIEGQARGVQRMVDADADCVDVLTQISSMTGALESVALLLLERHLHDCVRDATARGTLEGNEKVTEASAAITRLVGS